MNLRFRSGRWACGFLACLIGVAGCAQAAATPVTSTETTLASEQSTTATDEESAVSEEQDFVSIFNGKDLDGWQGPVDGYEVIDGVIRCKKEQGGTIYTKDQYADFVLRFEFKLPPGGNNGLAIRYPGEGDTAYVGMCELQVLDSEHEKFAGLDDRQYHGSAYGMVAAQRGALKPAGEWNTQQVTIKGSTIKVVLNGTSILDCDLSTVDSFLDDRPHPGKDRTEGHFGLAGHNDPVEFRNLRIKKLTQ